MNERYCSWVRMFEEQLCIKYRDSVRNKNETNPIFEIDSIPIRIFEGGFGIQAVVGMDLDSVLSKYAMERQIIQLDFNHRIFWFTQIGKSLMLEMDPQIAC